MCRRDGVSRCVETSVEGKRLRPEMYAASREGMSCTSADRESISDGKCELAWEDGIMPTSACEMSKRFET